MSLQQKLQKRIEVLNDSNQVLTFSGYLSPSEYAVAMYLHHRPSKLVGGFQVSLVVGYCAAIVLHGVTYLSAASLSVLIFPLCLLLLWRILFFETQIHSAFLHDIGFVDRYTFELTSEKICISSSNHQFDLQWSELTGYKKNRTLTLLYRTENEFFLFPHHWFPSSEDVIWFHNQLVSRVGESKR